MKKVFGIIFLVVGIFCLTISGFTLIKSCGSSCVTAYADESDVEYPDFYYRETSFVLKVLDGVSSDNYNPVIVEPDVGIYAYILISDTLTITVDKDKTLLSSDKGFAISSDTFVVGGSRTAIPFYATHSGLVTSLDDNYVIIDKLDYIPYDSISSLSVRFTQSGSLGLFTYTFDFIGTDGVTYISMHINGGSSSYNSVLFPSLDYSLELVPYGILDEKLIELQSYVFGGSTVSTFADEYFGAESSYSWAFYDCPYITPYGSGFYWNTSMDYIYQTENSCGYIIDFGPVGVPFIFFDKFTSIYGNAGGVSIGSEFGVRLTINYVDGSSSGVNSADDYFSIVNIKSTSGIRSITCTVARSDILPVGLLPNALDIDDSDYFQLGYDEGFGDGQSSGHDIAFQRGYDKGLEDAGFLSQGLFGSLLASVDDFLSISIFGNGVTLGMILSLSFGVILLGLAIKLFLGG